VSPLEWHTTLILEVVKAQPDALFGLGFRQNAVIPAFPFCPLPAPVGLTLTLNGYRSTPLYCG
jgi:hypothetical protein